MQLGGKHGLRCGSVVAAGGSSSSASASGAPACNDATVARVSRGEAVPQERLRSTVLGLTTSCVEHLRADA